ncbi:hypothetical protein F5Y06DRAFT_274004 [Hypoxylon sp. FL0890]|nr:hypothetical protein F5Y06DRAFT_274004 [Hypoxylon sp. FL0890]
MASDVGKYPEAILRVCSYHRLGFDLVLVRSRPHEMQVVQESLQTPFDTSPLSGLGVLDRLPPELMSMMLRTYKGKMRP